MMWLTELYLRMFTPREEEDKGATMVEYGLMVALIAVVAVAAVGPLGTAIKDMFDTVKGSL